MYVCWLREAVDKGHILLEYVGTNEQSADGLTKALPGPAVKLACDRFSGKCEEKAAHEQRQERGMLAARLSSTLSDYRGDLEAIEIAPDSRAGEN